MALKRVLVLGASGYVGSQLIPLLLKEGYAVTAVARQFEFLKRRVPEHPNLAVQYLDLADRESTLNLVNHFDLAFFLVHGMAWHTGMTSSIMNCHWQRIIAKPWIKAKSNTLFT